MRHHNMLRLLPVAMTVAGLVAACHDPETQLPTKPTLSTVLSVDFVAPASMAPGQSLQLVATVRLSNGPVKTALENVVWRTTVDPTLLQISSTGVLTAGQVRGEGIVTADVTVGTVTRRAQRTMLVMPDGTFRIVGTVKDEAFPFAPIAGARVEVAPGDLSATTDSAGQYRLYGVPPVADLQVTAGGYDPISRHVNHTANGTENFQVRYNGPLLTLSGNYTLAIDVPGACNGQAHPPLAAGLRHRTYDATVVQNGKALDVTLSGANLRVNASGSGNRFSGEVFGTGATFSLQAFYPFGYYYYYGPLYPSVAEALPDGTFLVVSGFAVTSGSAPGLSGIMHGDLWQWDAKFPDSSAQTLSLCEGDLQFVLTPK